MTLLTRYLSPLRVFARLGWLENDSVEKSIAIASVRGMVKEEREARTKAVADLRTDMLARFAPLARCARCGCIVDHTHPAVTVMRKGVDVPVAACLFCVSAMRTHGFKPVERASA